MASLNGNVLTTTEADLLYVSVRSGNNCQGNIVPISSGNINSGDAYFSGFSGGVAFLSVNSATTVNYNLVLGTVLNGAYKLTISNQSGICFFCVDFTVGCSNCNISVSTPTYECYNTGIYTASFIISGASGSYEYSDNGGFTYSSTTAAFSNNYTTGSHTVLIRDANNTACNTAIVLNYTNTCDPENPPNTPQDFCNFRYDNEGNVGVYTHTYTHTGATGTIYYFFNDVSINDILTIKVNGTTVAATNNVSGYKSGSFTLPNGATVEIKVDATVSTRNGNTVNTSTVWALETRCGSPYPDNLSACNDSCFSRPTFCQIDIISAEDASTTIGIPVKRVRVRARRNCIPSGGSDYRHDRMRATLDDLNPASYIAPTSVTGTGSSDYAEWIFSFISPGNYTVYIKNDLSLTDYMSYSGIIVT